MYIVIEGQDGTGKDVQAEKLATYCREHFSGPVIMYSESGTGSSDPFIQKLAELSHKTKQPIDHHTRTLLFLAKRYHQWQTLAAPTLEQSGIVITTRSWISTLVYEGYHGGVPQSEIETLHRAILPARYFSPDHAVILTLEDTERTRRLKNRDSRHATEVFKSASAATQNSVNQGYLHTAKTFNIATLDTSESVDVVFANLLQMFFGS